MSAHLEEAHAGHGSMGRLMTGLALAAILTIIPFALVMGEFHLSRNAVVGIIMALGTVQIIVHLVYFLHVNRQAEEGWTLAATIFSVVIVVIVMAGSLWVLRNMDEKMMPMPDMDHLMDLHNQQG